MRLEGRGRLLQSHPTLRHQLKGRQPGGAAGLQYAQASEAELHLLDRDRVDATAALAHRNEAAVQEGVEAWEAARHQSVDEAEHRGDRGGPLLDNSADMLVYPAAGAASLALARLVLRSGGVLLRQQDWDSLHLWDR